MKKIVLAFLIISLAVIFVYADIKTALVELDFEGNTTDYSIADNATTNLFIALKNTKQLNLIDKIIQRKFLRVSIDTKYVTNTVEHINYSVLTNTTTNIAKSIVKHLSGNLAGTMSTNITTNIILDIKTNTSTNIARYIDNDYFTESREKSKHIQALIKKIGEQYKVDRIIAGSLSQWNTKTIVQAHIYNTKTGRPIRQSVAEATNKTHLSAKLQNLAWELVGMPQNKTSTKSKFQLPKIPPKSQRKFEIPIRLQIMSGLNLGAGLTYNFTPKIYVSSLLGATLFSMPQVGTGVFITFELYGGYRFLEMKGFSIASSLGFVNIFTMKMIVSPILRAEFGYKMIFVNFGLRYAVDRATLYPLIEVALRL